MKPREAVAWLAALVPLLLAAGVFVSQLGVRNAVLATDFRAYYTAGRMLLGGVRSDFYTPATQVVWQQSWAPELVDPAQLNPFRNPPFVAALFAPFAFVPPELAFGLWSIVNLAVVVVVIRLAQNAIGEGASESSVARRRAILLIASFLPVMVTLLLGQVSLFLVLGALCAWTAFRAGHDGRAGLALGLLLIRPQFLLLPVVILTLHRRWRALWWLASVSVALLAISLAVVGWDGLVNYTLLLTGTLNWQDSYSISPQRMHTWRGFLQLLMRTDDPAPVEPEWLIGALVAAFVTLAAWRKWDPTGPRFDLQWALLIVASIFISPYANFHDLSLLVVAGVLATRAGATRQSLLVSMLPVVGYISVLATQFSEPLFHVQVSVLFMAAAISILAWHVWACARESRPAALSRIVRGVESHAR